MGSFLEKAKAHRKKLLENTDLIEIEVPEFEEKVYFRPRAICTIDEFAEFENAMVSDQNTLGMCKALVARLKNKDGKPLFKKAELAEVKRTLQPELVQRLFTELITKDAEYHSELDDVKKN